MDTEHILQDLQLSQCRRLDSVEERGIDKSGEAGIDIVKDKILFQPGEVEGEVDGAADGDGAEEVVEDVSLLPGKDEAKLALLEAVHLIQTPASSIDLSTSEIYVLSNAIHSFFLKLRPGKDLC